MFERFSSKYRIQKGIALANYLQTRLDALEVLEEYTHYYEDYPLGSKRKENWKKQLKGVDYVILFKKGSEKTYYNEYCENFTKGIYVCKACKQPLFSSINKYEAATGQPTFDRPMRKEALLYKVEPEFPKIQTYAHCSCCEGRIGSLHGDGITTTELRYHCQSGAILFIKE